MVVSQQGERVPPDWVHGSFTTSHSDPLTSPASTMSRLNSSRPTFLQPHQNLAYSWSVLWTEVLRLACPTQRRATITWQRVLHAYRFWIGA